MGNRLTAISITFLGVCVLVGAWLLSNSLRANAKTPVTAATASVPAHQLLTENQLEQYLGVSNSDLEKLTPGNGLTIPYITIGNKHYFSLSAVNNWLKTEASGIYK